MSDDRRRFLALADAVSDGKSVAWDDALKAMSPKSVRPVRALQLIDQIGAAYRALDLPLDPTSDSGVTQTSGSHLESDDSLPTTWGPLERLELVGTGSFGQVFRAWDPRLQRLVALKLLRRRAASDSSLADQVLTEGRLLARVRHPNVAVVYGVEEHDGRVGTWMEFVEGRTLYALVKERGPFGPREAVVVGVELCRALAAVHGAGLLHRDVKAQNVMREAGGRLVLMDFGAGLDVGSARGDEGLSGTPLYMAPELLDGERATVETDLYAEGVLLFFLLTGSYPVEADTLPMLKRAHEGGERRRLRDLRPDVPADFALVIQTAITRSPQNRFHTAGALEEALSGTLSERQDPATVAVGSRPPKRGRSLGRKLGRVQLAIAASLVLGGAVLLLPRWIEQSHTKPEPQQHEPGVSAAESSESPIAGNPDAHRSVPLSDPTYDSRTKADSLERRGANRNAVNPAPAFTPATLEASPKPTVNFQISASLYRDRKGSRERLLDGARVIVGDALSLEVEASESVYVYILHEDDRHKSIVLFPIPGFVPSNPIPAGLHRLPGMLNGSPIDWAVDSAAGHERILVVASRKAVEGLDVVLAYAPRPTSATNLSYPEVTVDPTMLVRGMGILVERPDTGNGGENVFELAKKLATHPEEASEMWVRQVELQTSNR